MSKKGKLHTRSKKEEDNVAVLRGQLALGLILKHEVIDKLTLMAKKYWKVGMKIPQPILSFYVELTGEGLLTYPKIHAKSSSVFYDESKYLNNRDRGGITKQGKSKWPNRFKEKL